MRVRRPDAEIVLAELLELAPGGVEEVAVGEDEVEYAIYGPPGELPALPDLEAAAGGALVTVRTSEIAEDWAERWRDFHRPLELDGRLRVRAPWHAPARAEEGLDVVIDPGQAFGTGAHATTRGCLELLLELPPGGPLLDLGCGSGVLAIAAAKLGWDPVLAVDVDPLAIAAGRENAVANRVEVEVEVDRIDLRVDPLPWAPTVVANLLRPLVLTYAERLDAAPNCLIASGLLREEAAEVAGAFARHGLRVAGRRAHGEWVAVLLARGA